MKKLYRIILLLVTLIFLTTYTPNQFNVFSKKKNHFFEIQNIEIINNNIISENEITKKLLHIYGKNILFIEGSDLQKPLKSIDFLEKIEVKKKYPNTVIVKIFETKTVGILFKGKTKYLLDSSSNLISFSDNVNFDQLPSIFGDDAESNFVYFVNQLEINNFPKKEIKNFYYFQIGRWDLQLVNNKIIKLPHNVTNDIIKKSVELLNRKDFENYNIIDLRVDGKIIVE